MRFIYLFNSSLMLLQLQLSLSYTSLAIQVLLLVILLSLFRKIRFLTNVIVRNMISIYIFRNRRELFNNKMTLHIKWNIKDYHSSKFNGVPIILIDAMKLFKFSPSSYIKSLYLFIKSTTPKGNSEKYSALDSQ